MNWSSKSSIWLSRLCVVVFGLVALAILVSAPWLVKGFVQFSRAGLENKAEGLLLATIYTGGVPAVYILWLLWRQLGLHRRGSHLPGKRAVLCAVLCHRRLRGLYGPDRAGGEKRLSAGSPAAGGRRLYHLKGGKSPCPLW